MCQATEFEPSWWDESKRQFKTFFPTMCSMLLYRFPWLISLWFVAAMGENQLAAAALATTICNVVSYYCGGLLPSPSAPDTLLRLLLSVPNPQRTPSRLRSCESEKMNFGIRNSLVDPKGRKVGVEVFRV